MKFSISQKDLQKHIQIAQKAISARNTIQILDGILFEAKDGALHLYSTDSEISIHTQVPCTVHKEGRIVLQGNMIANITRKLPNDTVHVEGNQKQVEIICKNSKFQLVSYNPDEYPPMPSIQEEFSMEISAKDWKQAVRQTIFATGQDDSKPVLRGVLFDVRQDGLFLVALDGFRIALKKLPFLKEDVSFIIPGRALQEIQKIAHDDQLISIVSNQRNMEFYLGDTTFTTKLLDGQFIDYKPLLNTTSNVFFTVDRKELYDAFERASLLSGEERANLIKLHLEDDHCSITSNTEMGQVFEMVYGSLEGEELEIAFNARYLLEGLKEVQAETVKLSFSGPLKPLLITSTDEEEGYTYLVLPVRLGQGAR